MESQIRGAVAEVDSFPPLPPGCSAVTLLDSTLYFTNGSPPVFQTRFIRSSKPETLFTFPASSHPVHIAVHGDRIAISDPGMNCLWASMGDSIFSRHNPGVYRKLTPMSSAWSSQKSVVFSGLWLSRINERLRVHYGCGSYDLLTKQVQFDFDNTSTAFAESTQRNPVDIIIGNGHDIRVVGISGNTITIRPLIAGKNRIISIIPPRGPEPSPLWSDLTIAGCILGEDGIISGLVRENGRNVLIKYRSDSEETVYLSISDIEPEWNLIGIMDDFIIWRPSSGEIIQLRQVPSLT